MPDSLQEADIRKERARGELIEAGFSPARYAGPVRLLRRLMWPFVRSFHFHTLDRVTAADAAIVRLEEEVRRLSSQTFEGIGGVDAAIARLEGEIQRLSRPTADNDVLRMVTLHARLRSDVLAIGNRHVWVEERVALALKTAEELRQQVAPKLARLVADSDEQSTRLSELHDQVRPMRDGLFLTAAQQGVFLLKAGELISETVRRDGAWDPHIVRVAAQASKVVRGRSPSASTLLAVDVGAHFGLISVALANLFDSVISFEPNTYNAALLRVNVLLNGLDGRVEVRREALAAREGSLSLAPSDRQEIPLPMDDDGHFALGVGSNLGAYSFVNDGTGLSAAKAIPLDHLALDDVAFIKVDTQGADGTVLLGAFETITRCRPWVVFEWEQLLAQAFAVSFEEVEARFAAIGYRVRVLHRHNAKQVDYLALPQEEADAVHEGEAG